MVSKIAKIEYKVLIIVKSVETDMLDFSRLNNKYKIFFAANANDAIPIIESKKIHFVISGEKLDGLFGGEIFTLVKGAYHKTRFETCLKNENEVLLHLFGNDVVFKYLPKPWNVETLEATIDEALKNYEIIINNRKIFESLEKENDVLKEKLKEHSVFLEKANKILQNIYLAKSQLIGSIAHDLRNPVGAIHSFSGLLIDEFDEITKEDTIKFIENIKERSTFILSLIESLVTESKTEAGIFDLEMKPRDFVKFLKDTVAQFNYEFEIETRIIDIKSKPESVELIFDKNKLGRVFTDILSCCVKKEKPVKNIRIDVSMKEKMVLIKVADKDLFLPENEIIKIYNPYIFSPENESSEERKPEADLALTRKIIDAHKGQINVESESLKGTVFTIYLPLFYRSSSN